MTSIRKCAVLGSVADPTQPAISSAGRTGPEPET
jgi:hypothetical protein